jgi:hypothetical protein
VKTAEEEKIKTGWNATAKAVGHKIQNCLIPLKKKKKNKKT